jgi:hypothetical protein
VEVTAMSGQIARAFAASATTIGHKLLFDQHHCQQNNHHAQAGHVVVSIALITV